MGDLNLRFGRDKITGDVKKMTRSRDGCGNMWLKKEKRHEDVQERRRHPGEGHHVCQFLNTNDSDDKDSNNNHPLVCFILPGTG